MSDKYHSPTVMPNSKTVALIAKVSVPDGHQVETLLQVFRQVAESVGFLVSDVRMSRIGRKRYDIPVENFLDALQRHYSEDGRVNYSRVAKTLAEKTGLPITRGCVHSRIKKEAVARGMSRGKYLRLLLEKGLKGIRDCR